MQPDYLRQFQTSGKSWLAKEMMKREILLAPQSALKKGCLNPILESSKTGLKAAGYATGKVILIG